MSISSTPIGDHRNHHLSAKKNSMNKMETMMWNICECVCRDYIRECIRFSAALMRIMYSTDRRLKSSFDRMSSSRWERLYLKRSFCRDVLHEQHARRIAHYVSSQDFDAYTLRYYRNRFSPGNFDFLVQDTAWVSQSKTGKMADPAHLRHRILSKTHWISSVHFSPASSSPYHFRLNPSYMYRIAKQVLRYSFNLSLASAS